jgi:hypothetical protein
MLRKLLILLTLLSVPLIAEGQTTTVTLNVTDSNSVIWANGTYTATLNPPAGRPPSDYFVGGVALTPGQKTLTGSLNAGGSASFSLTSNTSITPAQTTWAFQVCFTTGNPCYFSAPFTITGGTQTVNLTPPPVQSGGGGGGSSSNGTGGSANPAGPILGYYLGPQCPAGNTGKCFLTPANTVQFNDCNWTTGGPTVTCAGSHFTAADVGKNVMGGNTCASTSSTLNSNPGVNGQISTTTSVTIAAFISATQVTLSATPANSSGGGNVNCFIYGNNDDAAASAVDTALQADPQCQRLFMVTAGYFFKSPHFFTQPPACANTTIMAGAVNPGFGNVSLPAGFEWIGTGPNPTTIFLDPAFPNGDACTHKSTTSQAQGGCFAVPLMGKWRDLQLNGGPQFQAPNMAAKNLITAAVAELTNVTCVDYGAFTNSVGLNRSFLVMTNNWNNAGCGSIGEQFETNAGGNVGVRDVIEESAGNSISVNAGAGYTCFWCDFALPRAGTSPGAIVIGQHGGILRFFGGVIAPSNASGGAVTGLVLYKDDGGGSFFGDSTLFDLTNAPTGNGGIWCAAAGCQVSLVNGSGINAAGSNFAYQDGSGGILNIDRSFKWTGPFTDAAITGSVSSSGNSLYATCTGVANASATLGLFGTGPNATTTTCTSTTIGSGIVSDSARSAAAILCTSTATTVSVACKLVLNGTPSASLLCTMTATTHCENYTAVAINKGDLISAEIVTGAAETGANIKLFILWQ